MEAAELLVMGGDAQAQPRKNHSLRSPVDDDLRTWHDDLKEFCEANALKTSTLPTIIFGGYSSDSEESDAAGEAASEVASEAAGEVEAAGEAASEAFGGEVDEADDDFDDEPVYEIIGGKSGRRNTADKGFLMSLKENNVRFQLDEADPNSFHSSAGNIISSPAKHYLHSWHGLLKTSPQPEANSILPYLQENDSPNLQLSSQYNPFTYVFGGAVVDRTLESDDCGCNESIEASIIDSYADIAARESDSGSGESSDSGESSESSDSSGESGDSDSSDISKSSVDSTLSALIVNK